MVRPVGSDGSVLKARSLPEVDIQQHVHLLTSIL